MISFVRGLVAYKDETSVTVDVNGIGFRIQAPLRDLEKIHVSEEITFNTYFNVREDLMELYGFLNREDLTMFNLLITVNGVGPKAATSLLSAFTSYELSAAVVLSDAKKISKAQGIGAKTAQRIILELKDKVSNDALTQDLASEEMPAYAQEEEKEAINALMSLGYSSAEAQKAVKKGGIRETLEETIKAALITLMK
ncbi:MAG: Holliday junction branch migration protein RuvA [Bacillota bacterium]|nr:Holliday junction branch migration protein RuvA [Bacillota bacterium]